MDEEKNTVEEAKALPQEVEESTPTTEEHAEETETDTQPTSEAHVSEEEETGEAQSDSTVPSWEEEKKRMSGKISQLERERNELSQARALVEALDKAAASDPEFMKLANKKLVEQGLLDESALQGLDTAPQATYGAQTQDPAVQWAQAKMQEEQKKKEQFFVDFEERHPDLREGSNEIIRANRSAIGAAAAKKMAQDKVSAEDAYEFAYKLIMNPTSLIEEGKLEGMAQAQGAIPTEGAASGGVAKSSGKVELTPEQREAARLFGITEEEFANNLGE